MKKNYNQPEFVVVEMMPQTIICASGDPNSIVYSTSPGTGVGGE